MNEYTHFDLFSGIGGFSLAFEAEGFRTIGFSEIDPYANAILKKHWPNVRNYGDARSLPFVESVDVLTAGVPCQPASLSGNRRGTSDSRWLWPDTIKIIGAIRPAFAVLENPTGILSLSSGADFQAILGGLAAFGYSLWWERIPACALGAPHRRDRIFIIAHNDGFRRDRIVPAEPPRKEGATSKMCYRWESEPGMGRMVHGLSGQAYRIKCLGNSVVPAVAQIFARAIKLYLDSSTAQAKTTPANG